ncbi:MAG: GNAT family N-acetyltransferase [Nitrospiraceae bacterium]
MSWDRGGIELVDRLADEWRELCSQGFDDQPFFHPEWIRAYVRAFAAHTPLLLITARAAGRLVALLPLLELRQMMFGLPVRVLVSPTNVHSCRFDLVVHRGPEGQAALRAIWDSFKKHREWDILTLDYVSADGMLAQLVALARDQRYRTALIESFASPYFSLEGFTGDWDSWLSRLKGDFRREIRRRARKLETQGEVRLLRLDQANSVHLQRFYELEASGWKGGEGTAIMCDPAIRCFYDEVATAASERGYFSLYILEVSGRPIAGHFGLTYGNRYFVPKLAFDEQYSALAPGHLMVNAVARDCAERGVIEFDFLGGQMEWKACWTPLARMLHSSYVFNDNCFGHVLYTAKFGVKSAVKRLLGQAQ